ncbi:hypothetical protein ACPX19_08425 [Winogradskyella sp. HB-48]|uniref:hypothetical protein n=1 Tax=Winogradskyella sp. HB-48 TaxID=3416808 RepID=UPI003CEF380D
MKIKINLLFIYAFFALLIFTACQDEAIDINNSEEQEMIQPNTPLASFMSNVTANYGEYDNILDESSCFSIELPVTIIVGDVTIIIETLNDLETLEDLFAQYENEDDFFDFVFPFTIIFNDYTEVVIESEEQLQDFIEDCEIEDDEVIECVDFVYPISFSVFNANFNIVDTITIANDEALYNFLEELEDDNNALIVSLNYPVTLVYANGNTIEVNSNQELSDAIASAEADCDYYDEVFDCFGDFELLECLGSNNEAEFNLSADTIGLIDCQYAFVPSFHETVADAEAGLNAIVETESYWSAGGEVYLRIEAENGNFEVFTIYLNTEDCSENLGCLEGLEIVKCDENNDGFETFNLYEGLNELENCEVNDTVNVTYHETLVDAQNNTNPLPEVTAYTNISNPQTIYVRVELLSNPAVFEILEIGLFLEDCSQSGCSEEDVDGFLASCIWNAVNYNGSDNLLNWNFDFEPNSQIVVIYNNESTIDATWITSQSEDGVIVTFSNIAGPNIQAITGEWLVVECEEDRLQLHRGDDILVLERTCE